MGSENVDDSNFEIDVNRKKAFESLKEKVVDFKRFKKDQVFKVKTNKRDFLVKVKNISGKKIGFRHLKALAFKQESQLNHELSKSESQFFRVPDVFETDEHNYLIFEFVSGEMPDDAQRIAEALLEFQFEKPNITWQLPLTMWFHPWSRFFRNLIIAKTHNRITWHQLFKAIRIYHKCSKRQKRLSYTVLKHGDFHVYNLLMDKSKKVVVLDLETTIYSRKWFFSDIVRVCRNPDQFPHYDPEIIHSYLKLFQEKKPDMYSELNLKAQFRIGFFIKFLRTLNNNNNVQIRENARIIISEILLDDQKYSEWFNRNFEMPDERISEIN